jgi:WD40 repeat protein
MSLSFSKDGEHLVSGAYDNTAKVFKIKDWTLVQDYKEFSSYVYSVQFSPVDNQLLATGSLDKSVKIFNIG